MMLVHVNHPLGLTQNVPFVLTLGHGRMMNHGGQGPRRRAAEATMARGACHTYRDLDHFSRKCPFKGMEVALHQAVAHLSKMKLEKATVHLGESGPFNFEEYIFQV